MNKFLGKTIRHVFRQGTKANLEAAKATAYKGEPHYATDTKELFVSSDNGGEVGHEMVPVAMKEAGAQSGSVTVVTDIRDNAGQLQKKTQSLTYTNGVLTAVGTESAWANTTDI